MGRAVVDHIEAEMIPAHLHADDVLERRLINLLDDMAWVLDPEPHDPPPRHTEASGASLAVWAEAYRRVGGIPDIAAGEDRAFVRALWMVDARVRHDDTIRVTVSGRIVGRAQGGMADAIRRRIVKQDEFTDDLVEPAADAFRRYDLRNRARRGWRWSADSAIAGDLAISQRQLAHALSHRAFRRRLGRTGRHKSGAAAPPGSVRRSSGGNRDGRGASSRIGDARNPRSRLEAWQISLDGAGVTFRLSRSPGARHQQCRIS